jgi:hypothetical protein
MKWLEKNWLIVTIVILGYLYFNGTLSNLLGGTAALPASSGSNGTTFIGG